MKMDYFRGDLTDSTAVKEPLVCMLYRYLERRIWTMHGIAHDNATYLKSPEAFECFEVTQYEHDRNHTSEGTTLA